MRKSNIAFALVLILLVQIHLSPAVHGQNMVYARQVMDTLASPSMFGRGYVNNGIKIAADYIEGEMKRAGLKAFNDCYSQTLKLDVKTYPGALTLSINAKSLKAGQDFMIATGSPSVEGNFKLVLIDSTFFLKTKQLKKLVKRDLTGTLVIFNRDELKGRLGRMADSLVRTNYLNCGGFIKIVNTERLTWSVRPPLKTFNVPVFTVLSKALSGRVTRANIKVELKEFNDYPVNNIIGYVPGTARPDSFVVVTAHYDHLGMMGKEVYFPGANDNASGISMILNLAEHYSKDDNRLPYSIAFMALASEETGLNGSYHYVENPLFPLENIKFLINIDMIGTGSEGITMVNSLQFPKQYNLMNEINKQKGYIMAVKQRGESCNSDHCPFYQKGVPAVFIYSLGKEHEEYHNIYDLPGRVPMTEFEDIFLLLRDFINKI